jgi:hypothetical protein
VEGHQITQTEYGPSREIGVLLPNNQRQHRPLRLQKDVTVPRVSRSCQHFPDGLDLDLLQIPEITDY